MKEYDVIVIGGGPAGLMAAGVAAKNGAEVLLLEKNEVLGKKLLLTGGGRCNITNAEYDSRKFLSHFGKKSGALFSPMSVFGVADTIKFFENLGLDLKTEINGRVFPKSESSEEVLRKLYDFAVNNGVEIQTLQEVDGLLSENTLVRGVKIGRKIYKAKKYILASGGKSHPETGSTGEGFSWLEEIGHKITKPEPSLVPVITSDDWAKSLSGLSLDDVGISIHTLDKIVKKSKGKVLFTHFGLSGPGILNISKVVSESLKTDKVKIKLDLFPGVGLDKLTEDFGNAVVQNQNKIIRNFVWDKVPSKLLQSVFVLSFVDLDKQANSLTHEERIEVLKHLKALTLNVTGLLGFDKAIISSGGVEVDEVDFKTMQSKLFSNLYLIGDILDFDRPSGGYSLQLCWTTAYIAGKNSSQK